MKTKMGLALILLGIGMGMGMGIGGRAEAGSILSGSASLDAETGLYTYSYVVDNHAGPAPIHEISILIDSQRQISFLNPLVHTEPAGWDSYTATSGFSSLPPLNEFGTFWAWFNDAGGVPVGNSLGGFSFTTRRGPTPSSNNNYFLYSTTFTGGPSPNHQGIVEFGHIVAPDFSVPEPSSLVLFGLGILGLIGCRRRLWPRL